MDINTRAQQDLGYPAARFNEKVCLQVEMFLCFICLFWNSMPQLEQLSHEFYCKTHRKRATCWWMLKL
jgi:hypothetical protein